MKSQACLSHFSKRVYLTKIGSRDSSVRVVIGLQAGRPEVQIPAGARDFSILQNVQARSASNSAGTGSSFPGGKAAGA